MKKRIPTIQEFMLDESSKINETEVKTIYKAIIEAAEHSDHYEEGESVKPLRTWDKEIENNDLKTLLIEISLYILGSKDFKDILSHDNINDYDWGSELWASKGPLDKKGIIVTPRHKDWDDFVSGKIEFKVINYHIIISKTIESAPVDLELSRLGLKKN